jgi:hypothetical protein
MPHRADLECHKRTLRLLDSVRLAAPCNASWDDMVGDERVRHCGQCSKSVYNLSAMSPEEAEALVVAQEGDLCARMYQRTDGTIMTTDCPVGLRRRRVRRAAAAAVGAGLVAAGFLSFATQTGSASVTHAVMGRVRARGR